MAELRALIVGLSDQIDLDAAAFDGFDSDLDAVWMGEVADESTHVWSSKPRTVMFLAAMRHFAGALRGAGRPLHYTRLDAPGNRGSLAAQLQADILRLRPSQLVMTAPGDWRVLQAIRAVAEANGLPLDVREDRHFFTSIREFAAHAKGRKSVRLEYFYREQRKRHRVLMQGAGQGDGQDDGQDDRPVGGQWNFDADNRESFGPAGPGVVPPRTRFEPNGVTREVIALVNSRFVQHPGRLDGFAWPVTRAQALQSLQAFITERLPLFGRFRDAMWPGDPWRYHAHLSAALNVKLLYPREVVAAFEAAYRDGHATLASVEGFIRQILGWREYVRGIYWALMPGYAERNTLGAQEDLPAWYWTGATDMACQRDALAQTLTHGYAYHIQRLMVTGLYALMLGADPKQVHAWYLAVYVDAVEWAELPNTLGMSPHCKGCRYDPAQRSGDSACPFTTLYWDFLMRHGAALAKNPRMALQVKNVARLTDVQRQAVTEGAAAIRRGEVGGGVGVALGVEQHV